MSICRLMGSTWSAIQNINFTWGNSDGRYAWKLGWKVCERPKKKIWISSTPFLFPWTHRYDTFLPYTNLNYSRICYRSWIHFSLFYNRRKLYWVSEEEHVRFVRRCFVVGWWQLAWCTTERQGASARLCRTHTHTHTHTRAHTHTHTHTPSVIGTQAVQGPDIYFTWLRDERGKCVLIPYVVNMHDRATLF